MTFSDYVAKYARKIDWRKLVGSETSADDYDEDEGEDGETAAETSTARQQTASASGENELQKLLVGAKEEQGDTEKIQQYGEDGDEWAASSARDQESDTVDASQRGVGPWDSVAKRLM